MDMKKILIVEDEEDIRELIHFHLFKNKYDVIETGNGNEALSLIKEHKPNLVLLDIMLPGMDGIELCSIIKADAEIKNTKIIFLSAKGEEEDIINGLELGAEDYVSKPFSPKVLMARVKSVLRRDEDTPRKKLSFGGIEIDDAKKLVYFDGLQKSLTTAEYQLLKFLISSPGNVYTRTQIVNNIKGDNHAVTDRSVDTQVVSLRKKMGNKGEMIETVWGVGYRFKDNEA
jgi:two-component system phosphate regulon response regulator PhoB